MHGNDEGMIGYLGQYVTFGQYIFDIGRFALDQSFGDYLHGEYFGRVTVADLEDLAESSHADYFEELKVFGCHESKVFRVSIGRCCVGG